MFLDRDKEIERHGEKLPHWQQGQAMQFVTFRLGDSIPQSKLRDWSDERDQWLKQNPEPWEKKVEKAYHQRFTKRWEDWLDQGAGSCLLRNQENRKCLEEALLRFQGESVAHELFVIMPNHVHLLFTPLLSIDKLLKAWKGVSAREIGQGSIWQKGYRDTLIRDAGHYANAVKYIRKNSINLSEGEFTLWERERQ